jgi:tRNA G10  N-methylase Trm11
MLQLAPKIDTEFQAICPTLSDVEYGNLEESIKKEGCRDALVVWNSIILDGYNRYNICKEHDIEFKTTEVDLADRDAAIQWIIQNALARRNLTPVQKIELAERFRNVLEKQAEQRKQSGLQQNGSKCTVKPDLASREERTVNAQIGKIAGVGKETVRKYRSAKPHLNKKELEKLRRGEIAIDRAARISRTRINENIREEIKQSSPTLTVDDYKLFAADIKNGLLEIEDESIDIIVTDPPYNKESTVLFLDLAKVAARVLKPGCNLVAMVGHFYLPTAIEQLNAHLEYQWVLSYLTPGMHNQHIDRRVSSGWKPVLWYSKPGEPGRKIHIHDKIDAGKIHENIFHKWEQSVSGFENLMEKFVFDGDLVLDPFCGSGTTGLAAKALKCRFVGSDIDSGCVKIAASRLAEEPKPVRNRERIPALNAA